MRKRKIKKTGNSYYVKLEQTDMKDWDLKVGDYVIINKEEDLGGYDYTKDTGFPKELKDAMDKSLVEYGTTENYSQFHGKVTK